MESMIPPSPPSVRLVVVGLNHRTAPLDVRETVALPADQATAALAQLKAQYPQAECVLLSTCNRVELYLARPVGSEPTTETLALFLGRLHPNAPDLQPHLYHHEDRRAVEHLFTVASSLDSMVVGETQILSQVKQAYQMAADVGTVGKVFHTLFQRAFSAAKDVHESTRLSAGRVSVAGAAVDLARSVFDRFDDKTVACIGAGKMSTLMLRHLQDLDPRNILVTNRSPERGRELAAACKAAFLPFDQLPQLLTDADIILTCTGSTDPVIRAADFKAVLKRRRYRPAVIVDIALPRDVEPAVGELLNVYLYNLDDLQQVVNATRGRRDTEIDRGHETLRPHVEEFLQWFAARDLGPLVRALYEQSHQTGQAELADMLARHPNLDPVVKKDVERLVHRVIGKLLHQPVTQITQQTESTARPMLAAALKKLFLQSPAGETRPPPPHKP